MRKLHHISYTHCNIRNTLSNHYITPLQAIWPYRVILMHFRSQLRSRKFQSLGRFLTYPPAGMLISQFVLVLPRTFHIVCSLIHA